jgi:TorA maturation chaperone TorD
VTDDDVDGLRDDFNRLFIGPNKVLAPPWESVYFSSDRQMFQIQTLEVRNWYARFGLEIVNLNKEPDDHLGLELEFIAHLAHLALEAQTNGNEEQFTQTLEALRQFMKQHPLRWAQACLIAIDKNARTDFYRGIALLVSGALQELTVVLGIQGG